MRSSSHSSLSRFFFCIVIASLTFLGGCASKGALTAEQSSQIKSIGVVSLAAGIFHREYIGFTVFNNESESLDIRDWKIDELYETQMQQALGRLSYTDVVLLGDVRSAFYPVYEKAENWSSRSSSSKWSSIKTAVQETAMRLRLDTIVVVIASPAMRAGGLGLYGQGMNNSNLFLYALVGIFDGKTGELIAEESVGSVKSNPMNFGIPSFSAPRKRVSRKLNLTPLNTLTEQEIADLKRESTYLPGTAWTETFRRLLGKPGD